MDFEEKQKELEEIAKQVSVCKSCRLYQTAIRGVPGEGNPEAKIMFIGEGPGFYEDQSGRPFVGQAGKLLDQLLQSINLERKEVFIGNVVKHRPPENRDPLPDEIEACRQWLDRQLEIIQPEIIVTLGRFSMAKFLPNELISRVHGQPRFVEFQGRRVTVIPMYHPAAALRSSSIMEAIRNDFQKIVVFRSPQKAEEEKRPAERKNEQLNLID